MRVTTYWTVTISAAVIVTTLWAFRYADYRANEKGIADYADMQIVNRLRNAIAQHESASHLQPLVFYSLPKLLDALVASGSLDSTTADYVRRHPESFVIFQHSRTVDAQWIVDEFPKRAPITTHGPP